jgi:hypothetical protein
VLVFDEGQAGLLDVAALADSDCSDHLWKQLGPCPFCAAPDCVVLATLTNYRPRAEMLEPGEPPADLTMAPSRIDNRNGRRVLASTATLQAWLQCLHLKGGVPGPAGPAGRDGVNGANGTPGANGKDGLGLFPDLPKIIDIGWVHESQRNLGALLNTFLPLYGANGQVNGAAVQQRLLGGNDIPPFTIYFNRVVTGVTRHTMSVGIDAPLATFNSNTNAYTVPGLYWPLDWRVYGDIVPVQAALTTPHTLEPSPFAVSFVPRREFFQVGGQAAWPYLIVYFMTLLSQGAQVERPSVQITLKGNFVHSPGVAGAYSQLRVLDGDNVGGRVGRNETRGGDILGGRNPSGNLTQGGLFESWFLLTTGDDVNIGPLSNIMGLTRAASPEALFGAVPAPTVLNAAADDALVAHPHIARALARRIVAERKRGGPFAGVADFRARVAVTDVEWDALKDHLVIV